MNKSSSTKIYVPLWKQWQQTEEFQQYKKELPEIQKRIASMGGVSKKEREEIMAKQFQIRWVDKSDGKVKESNHNSEKSAKDKARELSFDNSPVQVGEIDGGKLLQQWNFDKGRQQAMDTKKQVSVAPISKKEASSIPSNKLERTTEMATNKKAKGKATKAAVKTKAAPEKKPAPEKKESAPKKPGLLGQFDLREGSLKEKLVTALVEAKGKPLSIASLLKAVYGPKGGNGGALKMILKGMQKMIDKNKINLEIVKSKNEKGEHFLAVKPKR